MGNARGAQVPKGKKVVINNSDDVEDVNMLSQSGSSDYAEYVYPSTTQESLQSNNPVNRFKNTSCGGTDQKSTLRPYIYFHSLTSLLTCTACWEKKNERDKRFLQKAKKALDNCVRSQTSESVRITS
jgi:hypothetical protein